MPSGMDRDEEWSVIEARHQPTNETARGKYYDRIFRPVVVKAAEVTWDTLEIFWACLSTIASFRKNLRRYWIPLCLVFSLPVLLACYLAPPYATRAISPLPAGVEKNGPLQVSKGPDFSRMPGMHSDLIARISGHFLEGSSITNDVKNLQLGATELSVRVLESGLSSKDEIIRALEDVDLLARRTGKKLRRFGAKVTSAVDHVFNMNECALREIEAANSPPSALSLRALWPRVGRSLATLKAADLFIATMEVTAAELAQLELAAQDSLKDLDDIGEKLATLHAELARANATLTDALHRARAGGSANPMTWFVRNRKQLDEVRNHLVLLHDLTTYRKHARMHVVGALHTLEDMEGEMEELRARVAAPGVVGDKVPMEVLMRDIRDALERLTAIRISGQVKERPTGVKIARAGQ